MEQQTVTIAKAGIHASLNARCSVLAAANPVYGQYDRQRSPQSNIGLPDSLLSRFDLLFIVLDSMDPAFDRVLSEHVIRSHQYRKPGTTMEPEPLNQDSSVNLDETADTAAETAVWQRGGRGSDTSFGDGREGDVLTKDFLKKYIHYAKRIIPELSDEAMEIIANEYARMRSKQTKRNLPITARSLETLIRLSTASAKSRLSVNVEEEDVTVAVDLLNFVLFHDISSSKEGVVEDENIPNGNKRKLDTITDILSDEPISIHNSILDVFADLQGQGEDSIEVSKLVDIISSIVRTEDVLTDVMAVLESLVHDNKVGCIVLSWLIQHTHNFNFPPYS
jgi:DNA replication licensing factor MCM3